MAQASVISGQAQSVVANGLREDAIIVADDGRSATIYILRGSDEAQFLWPGERYDVYFLDGHAHHVRSASGTRYKVGKRSTDGAVAGTTKLLSWVVTIAMTAVWTVAVGNMMRGGLGGSTVFALLIVGAVVAFLVGKALRNRGRWGWAETANRIEKSLAGR